jgi:hypothetical protein
LLALFSPLLYPPLILDVFDKRDMLLALLNGGVKIGSGSKTM